MRRKWRRICVHRLIFLYYLLINVVTANRAKLPSADTTYSDVFLMPQDFDLANTNPGGSFKICTNLPLLNLTRMQNSELFEGDIIGIPPENSFRRLHDDVDDVARIFGQPFHSSLNVDTYADKLWENGRIPYLLEEGMTPTQRAAIAQAFTEYRDKTCIKFMPKEEHDYDYIYIKRNVAFGCSSYVGRAGGNQSVSLEVNKCFSKGVIAHELMHAIGFFHEHSRTDRDDYVAIDENNIRPGMARNFEKYPQKVIDTLGMPYDYESIMHYHKLAFSRNGRPTIVPRNNTAEIGQRYKLSDVDALKINRLYRCEGPTTEFPSTGDFDKEKARPTPPQRPMVITSSEERTRSSERPGGSRTSAGFSRGSSMVTVSQQPPTIMFTRVTSDRWKYLTDHYTSTTTPRPRTSRLSEVVSSEKPSKNRYTLVTSKSGNNKSLDKCTNLNAHCHMWYKLGHCEHSKKYMSHYCRKSCGLCPRVDNEEKVVERIRPTTTNKICVDKNLFCGYWSRIGECRSESKFMKIFCKRSCGLC
ncbi:Astacin-like metalloendopeptidase [Aphelenchoides bicaudatus]|nr:Astacin-like metalloendopeptidase [Aphelenchoides bicaudatus]